MSAPVFISAPTRTVEVPDAAALATSAPRRSAPGRAAHARSPSVAGLGLVGAVLPYGIIEARAVDGDVAGAVDRSTCAQPVTVMTVSPPMTAAIRTRRAAKLGPFFMIRRRNRR